MRKSESNAGEEFTTKIHQDGGGGRDSRRIVRTRERLAEKIRSRT